MCGKKPKKPKAPPKVVERDVKAEQEAAAAEAAKKANEEAAQARKAKSKMLAMRSSARGGSGATTMPGATGGKTKLGA
jgi:ABC-type Na+ efflux pump permease subunit